MIGLLWTLGVWAFLCVVYCLVVWGVDEDESKNKTEWR